MATSSYKFRQSDFAMMDQKTGMAIWPLTPEAVAERGATCAACNQPLLADQPSNMLYSGASFTREFKSRSRFHQVCVENDIDPTPAAH